MATPRSSSESTTPQPSNATSTVDRVRDTVVLKKPCAVDRCDGIMYFHDANRTANGPHTLEWPWYAMWVCSTDSAHIEVVPAQEYKEIRRLRGERERQPTHSVSQFDTRSKRSGILRGIARRIATLFGSRSR